MDQFEQELNRRLSRLPEQVNTMHAIIDHALEELSAENKSGKKVKPISKNIKPVNLDNNVKSLSGSVGGSVPRKEQKQVEKEALVSEMVNSPELVTLFEKEFPNTNYNEEIELKIFLQRAIPYYFGKVSISPEELSFLADQCRAITTTHPSLLSIHALDILSKKKTLPSYLLPLIIQAKIDQTELLRQNIILEHDRRASILQCQSAALEAREMQLKSRAKQLSEKERQLSEKEKEGRKIWEERRRVVEERRRGMQEMGKAMFLEYEQRLGEIGKKVEKKISDFERSMRNKLEVLERRSEKLKVLRSELDKKETKKMEHQNQSRIRSRKLERELEVITKKHSEVIEQYANDERDFLRSIALLEAEVKKMGDKIAKRQHKIMQLETSLHKAERDLEEAKEGDAVKSKEAEEPKQKKSTTKRRRANEKALLEIISVYEYCLGLTQQTSSFSKELTETLPFVYAPLSRYLKVITHGCDSPQLFLTIIRWHCSNPNIIADFSPIPNQFYLSEGFEMAKLYTLCVCPERQGWEWLSNTIESVMAESVRAAVCERQVYLHLFHSAIGQIDFHSIVGLMDISLALLEAVLPYLITVEGELWEVLNGCVELLVAGETGVAEEAAEKVSIVSQRVAYHSRGGGHAEGVQRLRKSAAQLEGDNKLLLANIHSIISSATDIR